MPGDFDRRPRHGTEFIVASAGAHDLQVPSFLSVEFDGEVYAFVWDQRRDHEVVFSGWAPVWGRGAAHGVHWRVHNLRVASVEAFYAVGDIVADRHEEIHLGSGFAIPFAESGQKWFCGGGFDFRAAEILFEKSPCVPHWREADAEVFCVFSFAETFCDAVAGGDE